MLFLAENTLDEEAVTKAADAGNGSIASCPAPEPIEHGHYHIYGKVQIFMLYFYCCADHLSCSVHVNSIDWATWAIWASTKKYSFIAILKYMITLGNMNTNPAAYTGSTGIYICDKIS